MICRVVQLLLLRRVGQKAALDDHSRTFQLLHQVDRALRLLGLPGVGGVAALGQGSLQKLCQRFAVRVAGRIKHLCAVILGVAELVEMDAQENRVSRILHELLPRLDVRDLVLPDRAGGVVVQRVFVRARHRRAHAEKRRQRLHALRNAQVDILLGRAV